MMYQLKVSVLVDCFTITEIKPGDVFNFKSFLLQVLISTDVMQSEERFKVFYHIQRNPVLSRSIAPRVLRQLPISLECQ